VLQHRETLDRSALEKIGGQAGFAKLCGTSLTQGHTDASAKAMQELFGKNEFPATVLESFCELFLGAFEDPVLLLLLAAAIVSISIGMWQHPDTGYIEGTAIFIAVFLVSFIGAGNDYSKQLQFLELEAASAQDERCSILRNGAIVRLCPADIVVGDVIIMQAGDMIPADAIVIDSNVTACNESTLTGEPDDLKKSAAKDCFLYSSSTVTEGEECRAIVNAVGPMSQWGIIKASLTNKPGNTPLQDKLEDMCSTITYLGGGAAVLTFIALFIRAFVAPEGEQVFTLILHAFIIAVTIIVVAIPEGLPLAVTIALAYSTKKMYQDQCFIKVLAACETMGNATQICSDKTGTLTENQMTVTEGFFAGAQANVDANTISKAAKDVIAAHSCVNRVAYLIYKDANGNDLHRPSIIGNKTEGALLMMAKSWGYDDEVIRKTMFNEETDKIYAFNSGKKRSTAIIKQKNGGKDTRLFCKGATEWIIKDCTHYTDTDGSIKVMDAAKRKEFLEKVIPAMADRALRTLCLCHKDLNYSSLPKNWRDSPPDDRDLIMDCIVGIIDPLRSDVKEAVRIAQGAGVTVRMVTGDNIATAKAIARQCGILQEGGEAIEGPAFRALSPEAADALLPRLQVMARSAPNDKYLMVTRLNGNEIPATKEEWEEKHKDKPGVSWDTHKDVLLPGYVEEWEKTRPNGGEVVGVTGDGTNDAPALKAADVGLAMGITGTKVAQGASDMVILDDKFSSIVKAIMWGRSVYDNIRKFLQFQLTVNVVACLVVFIGAVSGAGEPLTAVQMLWVNLIMDTMGALALATEPPSLELLNRKPYKRDASLISWPMWRNILCQSAFQIILLCVLLFSGPEMFGVQKNESCAVYENTGTDSKMWDPTTGTAGTGASYTDACSQFDVECPDGDWECYEDGFSTYAGFKDECLECTKDDFTHGSIIFNTFIFAQIFNEYNARSIFDDLEVWSGAFKNPIFMGISVFTIALQVMLIEVGGEWIRTAPLTAEQWLITVGLGAIAIPVHFLMRFIPVKEDPESFAS